MSNRQLSRLFSDRWYVHYFMHWRELFGWVIGCLLMVISFNFSYWIDGYVAQISGVASVGVEEGKKQEQVKGKEQEQVKGKEQEQVKGKEQEQVKDRYEGKDKERLIHQLFFWVAVCFFAFYGSRALMFRHLYWLGWMQTPSAFGEQSSGQKNILASQDKFVKRVLEIVQGFSLDKPGPLLALRGGWGTGKSYILDEVAKKLSQNDRVVVVFINIWREQSERDLHLRIVEKILSNHETLRVCFYSYPVRHIYRLFGQWLFDFVPSGLKLSYAGVDVLLDPRKTIPLLAQKELEVVVRALNAKGYRLVVMMDEIDRATAPVAQATISLTRRALNLPGVAVVLPYVQEQLRRKVFDPTLDFVPEIHQTTLINVAQNVDFLAEDLDFSFGRIFGEKNAENKSEVGKESVVSGGGEDKKGGGEGKKDEVKAEVSSFYDVRARKNNVLARKFLELPLLEQERLMEQGEEKYLSLRLNMPSLEPGDLKGMVDFPTLAASTKDFFGGDLSARDLGVNDAIKALMYLVGKGDLSAVPTIRVLEGRLLDFLEEGGRSIPDVLQKNKKETFMLLCAVAWFSSSKLIEKRG